MLIRETAGSAIQSMVFSPDGETLVTAASTENRIQLWRGPFLDQSTQLLGGSSVVFSPSGRYLLTGSIFGHLGIHDMGDPLSKERLIVFPGPISGIAFVGREQMVVALGQAGVAGHYPTSLWLLKIQSDTPQRLPVDCRSGVRAIVGYPDRRLVVWVTDNKWLYVQDITRAPAKPHALKKDCRAIALSPDGKFLAVTADWDVLLFDVEKWPSVPRIIGRHTGMVTCLAFTPDGRTLLSGGWDETVRTWDVRETRPPTAFAWPVGRVTSLAVAPDGLRAVVGGETGTLSVWDLDD
ncbi:WD40 repeat domain-containing protein [Zavarzinella formosa]|uniref:WD40 repeat domain-containing protein n=1 Tax=Zavarzinella formosa TaxID=360055 RepID=UPI0002F1EB6E|nr:hypothetical protein [Zavarzinella formosa]